MTAVSDKRLAAFSLIEVVMAVGVFAFSIVAVIGLFAPSSTYSSDVLDDDGASQIVNAVSNELRRLPYSTVISLAGGSIYSSRSGREIGALDAVVPRNEAYFRIDLTLDNVPASDGFAEFAISIRWPAYLANAQEFPQAQQRAIVFKTVVPRSR